MDDVFVVWPYGRDKLMKFLAYLNSIPGFSCIQFTIEMELEQKLPYLDILFERDVENLKSTVYRKPTNSGSFLKKTSCHQPSQKISSISALTHRARVVCSDRESFHSELDTIRALFLVNGFPNWDIDRGMKAILGKPNDETTKEYKRIVRVPYLGSTYHKLARVMHSYEMQPVPYPHKQLISKLKDHLSPRLKQNVCYQISCDCGDIYVGEMGRVAEIRWGEHKKQWEDDIKKRKETTDKNINWTQEKTDAIKSSFKYHMDHEPDFERGTVLSTHKWES
ncbi:MAG: hypothetical protein GY696_29135, partial [Gammaproteobacteria bacterium]|nr:hypothetical protein [Gammaproteobacteria bacterium]